MPPKSRITKEMITKAAYEIVKENGSDSLNARSIAERLNCSTQPVLYCYKTMDEIKCEVYRMADEYHSAFLMRGIEESSNPMHKLGSNYIRFGYEEKNLFRFLFQSNSFSGRMQGLFEDEALSPIIGVLMAQRSLTKEAAQKVFSAIFYSVHGIASLLANNTIEYREDEYSEVLQGIFLGALNEFGGKQIC